MYGTKHLLLIILFGISLLTSIAAVTMSNFNLSQLSYGQSNNNTIISARNTNLDPHISTNNTRSFEINLLADSLQNRLNKSAAILEVTSKLPQVMNFSYSNSFNPSLHGIPKDIDLEKRQVAQNILDTDKDIQIIFVNMPNGNFYLEQPYSRQINLTTNNIASNEFFKGAIDTHDIYLSGVFVSNSSGLREASITVPVYSIKNNNEKNLVGTWAGALNLTLFNKSLQNLNLTDNNNNNKRVVYVDQYGQKIADSNKQLSGQDESFASLLSFKNAIMGKSGSNIENINGTKLLVSYHPVKVHTTNWVVLLMESYFPRILCGLPRYNDIHN
jgi:hypothetical protein